MKFSAPILHTKLSSNGFVKIDQWHRHLTKWCTRTPTRAVCTSLPICVEMSTDDLHLRLKVDVSWKPVQSKQRFSQRNHLNFAYRLYILSDLDTIRGRRCSQQPRLMHECLFYRSQRTYVIFGFGRGWLKPYFPHLLPGFAKITYNKTAFNVLQHVRVSLTIEARNAAFFEWT
jgi:hypothetical protein